ncbi:MAG TPA: carboxyl transferase domain-containing protein [Acidimicrobiales bacterium]|nr:carboxyl transferase domain-containing protein [Acidimicrobiales bacterium]
MPVLPSSLDVTAPEYRANRAAVLQMVAELEALWEEAASGGGAEATGRLRERGKLPVRERVARLIDRDSPFLELSALAGVQTNYAVGGGLLLGVGVVEGTECVVLGNDPTVLGGAMTAVAYRKIERGLEVARLNRLPYIQLVESAGGDLRGGGGGRSDPEEELRRNMTHFAETGSIFHDITELSGRRIPTVSVVFGSSTAGGAYQPGLSDYNIFVKDQAKVFLGGPPLVKMATGEDATDEELGGAEMHARVSGLADYLAGDEAEAIAMARRVVSHLHWRKLGPGPSEPADEPVHDPDELLGVLSPDLRSPLDVREVIARVVDGSRFEEFKPLYGETLVCGFGSVHGFPVGILGNNGVLFSDSSEKAAQFIQLCNAVDTPLVFLQNITGYMVGREYERGGIVKHGSQMLNALSNSTVPHVTVILGASYGAGNYGMGGRAFDTRFVFCWPTAKIAVMGPKQMAGVMSLVRRARAARRGEELDEGAEALRASFVEQMAERASLALYATGRVADDGVIDPRDTRHVVGMALSACHSNEVRGASGFGVFRL